MALTEAILALVSGLGGAGIGAAGASLVQRAKRRDDAAAAAAAADRAEAALASEVVATARAEIRAWWTNAQRVLGSLQGGRCLSAAEYEAQVREELKGFTSAFYRIPVRVHPERTGSPRPRSFADHVTAVSNRIVEAVHRGESGRVAGGELADLWNEGFAAHREIAFYLVRCAENASGRPYPAGSAGSGYPLPAPGPPPDGLLSPHGHPDGPPEPN
ncbi:hypothetical protein ACIF6K_18905 [Streptomyces sp. NPDC085942]|uniref:hypothetical protein n=1 Tax=Streptomyces sp. NPDC085942 TaxID=3365743 RepID=UPI0037CD38F3